MKPWRKPSFLYYYRKVDDNMTSIHSIAQKHFQSIIELRRYLHSFPELGKQEFNTQKRILQELSDIGLTCRPIAGTSLGFRCLRNLRHSLL